jgi:glycine dehydrogenase
MGWLTWHTAYGDLNLFCTCPPVEDTTGGHMSSIQEV